MSWLLPAALGATAVAIVAALALHFIARRRPLAEPLPTARFIPNSTVRARTRVVAPSDLLLFLLRVAALLAIGAAVAGPIVNRHTGRVAHVIVIDRSHAVRDLRAVVDSVRPVAATATAIVAFDSSALVVRPNDLALLVPSGARGSLSAALAAAIRAGTNAAVGADSVAIAIVSPFAAEELDSATQRIRASWPGRVQLVHVAGVRDSAWHPLVLTDSGPTDPIVAAVALSGTRTSSAAAAVRLRRAPMSAADTAWARASGHVLVHWPAWPGAAGWRRRDSIDAVGAVVSAHAVATARFPRAWTLVGRAVARWPDGTPAAVERETGQGCVRDVGVLVDHASDATLGAPFAGFLDDMLAPCGGGRASAPIDSAALAALGDGPPATRGMLASASSLGARPDNGAPATPWLLALGALLLVAELAARRPRRVAHSDRIEGVQYES